MPNTPYHSPGQSPGFGTVSRHAVSGCDGALEALRFEQVVSSGNGAIIWWCPIQGWEILLEISTLLLIASTWNTWVLLALLFLASHQQDKEGVDGRPWCDGCDIFASNVAVLLMGFTASLFASLTERPDLDHDGCITAKQQAHTWWLRRTILDYMDHLRMNSWFGLLFRWEEELYTKKLIFHESHYSLTPIEAISHNHHRFAGKDAEWLTGQKAHAWLAEILNRW